MTWLQKYACDHLDTIQNIKKMSNFFNLYLYM